MKKVFSLSLIGVALFFLLFVLFDNYYSENMSFSNTIESTKNRDKMPLAFAGGGISLGLYDWSGNIERSRTLNLDLQEDLKKFISISNSIPVAREYKLLVFIDYNQSYFYLDDKLKMNEIDFKMEPYETREIPIVLKHISEGKHDLLFVLFKDPYNHSLDDNFRFSTDMNNALFLRYVVNVANSKEFPGITEKDSQFIRKSNTILQGILVNKSFDYNAWLTDKYKRSKNIDFYIHVGNKSNTFRHYAILTLLDWKPVFFDYNPFIVIGLNANEEIVIPVSSLLPDQEGVSELVSILVTNPFSDPNDSSSSVVETSIRTGIIIE